LSRDLSAKKQYEEEVSYPEFGKGSEFGKRRREEARRLKYGRKAKPFDVEKQPWDLSVKTFDIPDDKKGIKIEEDEKPQLVEKNYHGKKEGGIGASSMYFVFTQLPDHSFAAHPIEDWCNFSRKIIHKTLTDEQVEEEWDNRNDIVNHLNYMARKRLCIVDNADGDNEAHSSTQVKKEENPGGLQIHDASEQSVGIMQDSDSEEEPEEKMKKRKKPKKEPKHKENSSDSEEEKVDSDGGPDEGAEITYDTDVSSEDEMEKDERVAPKGIDQLSESSSSDEDEEENDEEKEKLANSISKQAESAGDSSENSSNENSNKNALLQKTIKKEADEAGSSSGSKPSNFDAKNFAKMNNVKKEVSSPSRGPLTKPKNIIKQSKAIKRSLDSSPNKDDVKRAKVSNATGETTQSSTKTTISIEALRKILLHKPITISKLLKKFKSTGLNKQDVCKRVSEMLGSLKICKVMINSKMHVYLKP